MGLRTVMLREYARVIQYIIPSDDPRQTFIVGVDVVPVKDTFLSHQVRASQMLRLLVSEKTVNVEGVRIFGLLYTIVKTTCHD